MQRKITTMPASILPPADNAAETPKSSVRDTKRSIDISRFNKLNHSDLKQFHYGHHFSGECEKRKNATFEAVIGIFTNTPLIGFASYWHACEL